MAAKGILLETVWKVKPIDQATVAELAFEMEIPRPIAALYVQRGLTTPEHVKSYQDFSRKRLHNPYLLPDIEKAVKRLSCAIDSKERIYVHGDYDVDGVTSTAVITHGLTLMGANFSYQVPHRVADGYDVKPSTVDKALEDGATLLMTVDCGIVAFDTAIYAKEKGVDLLITDHHTPSPDGKIPECVAVVNPSRHDSQYPFTGLAGVGVAFKVMIALGHSRGFSASKLTDELIEYVALGTVADVAPMIDENRILVKLGCEKLTHSDKAGIRELLKVAGVKTVNTTAIGFFLGPRINAIGRMADAETALRLMLETNENRAALLAHQIDTANKRRQDDQEQVVKEAIAMVPEDMSNVGIVVVGAKGWHKGLVGLAAGKLAEQFGRPALVCAITEDGIAKGSCRSYADFHILDALRSEGCRELFSKKSNGDPICGGHAFAAGFEIPAANLKMLQDRLNEYAASIGSITTDRVVTIDARIQPGEINTTTYGHMMVMSPFGSGNTEPVFLVQNMCVQKTDTVGAGGKHLKLKLRGPKSAGPWVNAIAWRRGDQKEVFCEGVKVDVVFKLSLEEFRGRTDLTMTVEDIRLSESRL